MFFSNCIAAVLVLSRGLCHRLLLLLLLSSYLRLGLISEVGIGLSFCDTVGRGIRIRLLLTEALRTRILGIVVVVNGLLLSVSIVSVRGHHGLSERHSCAVLADYVHLWCWSINLGSSISAINTMMVKVLIL